MMGLDEIKQRNTDRQNAEVYRNAIQRALDVLQYGHPETYVYDARLILEGALED